VSGDLAGLKTVFGWAVSNGHIDSNPVEKVTIKPGRSVVYGLPAFQMVSYCDLESRPQA